MSIAVDDALVKAVLRSDFHTFTVKGFRTLNSGQTFQPNWSAEAIGARLQSCLMGQTTRLIVTLPPRSLKSLLVSVMFPAFVLGHDPTKRVICVSYGQDLAAKFSRDFRTIVTTSWYRDLFPNLKIAKDSEAEFETTVGGFRMSTSVGGALTGRGGDFIVLDDPLKADDAESRSARDLSKEFFSGTLFSRLDNKATGVIILVMQRLHEDDLAGFLLKLGGWDHLNFPAIAERTDTFELGRGRVHHRKVGDLLSPLREPAQVLDATKRLLGAARFEAQYQQNPLPETGNIVQREWLRFYTVPPEKSGGLIVQSWDTAQKTGQANDYSVCMTWLLRGTDSFLIDVFRRRCDFPDLVRMAVELHRKHAPSIVLIEDHGSGTALIQDLAKAHRIRAIARRPIGDKVMRLSGVTAAIERGDVHFPEQASWLPELLQELLGFPQSSNDDQVDSLSQYLTWVRDRPTQSFEADFGW